MNLAVRAGLGKKNESVILGLWVVLCFANTVVKLSSPSTVGGIQECVSRIRSEWKVSIRYNVE